MNGRMETSWVQNVFELLTSTRGEPFALSLKKEQTD
jgi:hypothetical protein